MFPVALLWHGALGGVFVVAAAAGVAGAGADGHITLIVGLAAAFAALVTPVVVAVIQRRPSSVGADPLSTQMVRAILDELESERLARQAAELESARLRAELADWEARRRPRRTGEQTPDAR